MFKKVIISFMAAITIISWGYASYKFFQPKTIAINNVTSIEDIMMVSKPQQDVRTVEEIAEPKVYFYCSEEDVNCQYVSDQILSQLAKDLNTDRITDIQYVDVTSLDAETALRRKNEYGFATYPAFVIYEENKEGVRTPVASLEYNENAPFTLAQLEEWLNDNAGIKVIK
ncbi:MAG: hypothetical protein E7191_02045 [Erysipelotrichaceae bacterium]|nr:hypothetical protein [Erysipelotrichaceae bacterium]